MEFIGDLARKTGEAPLLRIEAEKSRLAAQIGLESGLFRVPNILRLDEDAGVLEFERLYDLTTFGSAVARNPSKCDELALQVGRALARVHQDLQLEDSSRVPLPDPWMNSSSEDVFIHGDFTTNNVCINEERMELVIVDWSAAPIVGRRATLGPRGFDVICFARHLHLAAPWTKTLGWPAGSLCDLFIRAYVETFGAPLDTDTWQKHRLAINSFSIDAMRERLHQTPTLIRAGKSVMQHLLLRRWHSYAPPADCLTRPLPPLSSRS